MLNDAKVRAAKPRDKAYKLTDSNRLFLLVTPSGGKLWRWNYSYDGKQKSMSFGIYPMVALLTAREKRDQARAILSEGRDPSIAKKLMIEANIEAGRNTFERIAREWHSTSKPQWARVHAEDVIRSLERDVFPAIGSLPIADLKPPKVLEVLKAVDIAEAERQANAVAGEIRNSFRHEFSGNTSLTDGRYRPVRNGSAFRDPE